MQIGTQTFDDLIQKLVLEHGRALAEMDAEIRFLKTHNESLASSVNCVGGNHSQAVSDAHLLNPFLDVLPFQRTADKNGHKVAGASENKAIKDDDGRRNEWKREASDVISKRPSERLHPFHSSRIKKNERFGKETLDVLKCTVTRKNYACMHLRQRMMLRMESTFFEMFIGGLILLNTFFMALEMQYNGSVIGHKLGLAEYGEHPEESIPQATTYFTIVERIFVTIFTVELLVRIAIFRSRFCWQIFNWLDVLVVVAGLLDWIASSILDAKMIRMLRLCKVARGLRALRSVSSLDSLQLIIKSITASLSTLLWSLIVLGVIQCISGMILSQLLNDFFNEANFESEDEALKEVKEVFFYYGTFSRSMVTMFEVSLANWAVPCRILLNNAGEGYAMIILLYKITCGFAVLNVIAAVFIQQTMKIMQQDTDIMLMEKQRVEHAFEKKMKTLFAYLDISRDGHISMSELEAKMDDPEAKLQAYFLGIDLKDIEDMFDLLENPESMTADEFLAAAGKIRKQAKTIDIAHILGHVKHIEYNVARTEQKVNTAVESLSNLKNICKQQNLVRDEHQTRVWGLQSMLTQLHSKCDLIVTHCTRLPDCDTGIDGPSLRQSL